MTNTLDFVPYVRSYTVRITLRRTRTVYQTKFCLRPILKSRRSLLCHNNEQRRSSAFVRGEVLPSSEAKFCLCQRRSSLRQSRSSDFANVEVLYTGFLLDRRSSLRRVFAGYLHWILVNLRIIRCSIIIESTSWV